MAEDDRSYGPHIWVRGPVVGESEPSADAEAEAQAAQPEQLAWVNAHGGAGASTLATVLGGADIGHRWPDPARGEPASLLLVARTHASGLQAVGRALDLFRREEQPPGLRIAGVVLVADAPGRLPRQLNQRIKIISSVVDVYRVPWVSTWRTGDLRGPVPREVATLARLISGAPEDTGRKG